MPCAPSSVDQRRHAAPTGVLRTSLAALFLIALLALGTHMEQTHVLWDQQRHAHARDLAARQQKLSHTTMLMAFALLADPRQEAPLRAALAEMEANHRVLRDGDPLGRSLLAPPPEAGSLLLGRPNDIDWRLRQHIWTLQTFLSKRGEANPLAEASLRSHAGVVANTLDPLLHGSDGACARAAERSERRLVRVESALMGAMLLTLIGTYLVLFRPLSRRVQRDFHALLEAHDTLERAVATDPLTGIGNRSALATAMQAAEEQPLAVLQVDLDHFKTVNDLLGHESGDQVLCRVADAMRAVAGPADRAFRIGGDEFVLLMTENVNVKRAASRAARLIAEIDARCPSDAANAGLASSIGVAVYPDGQSDRCHLLANADIALYEAKALGRHRFWVFRPKMREPIETRRSIEYAFRKGLDLDEVILHLQPQVDLRTERLIGLEGLARWQRPDGEVLGADRFIPFIENTPLIREVTDRLVAQVIALQQRLRLEGWAQVPIGLNVADLQVRDRAFADNLLDRLRVAGLGPDALSIEVVERAFVGRGQEQVAAQLRRLADAGMLIELDDFGTGHASLTHVKTFPVGRIKIDRSFVSGIGRNEGDETIVRATIEIAQSFRRSVIAEGIETEAQRAFLLRHGCAEGQGYLFAPPLPETDLFRWLKARGDAPAPGSSVVPRDALPIA